MKRYETGALPRLCTDENGNLLVHIKIYKDKSISLNFDHYTLTAGEFDRIATWFARCNEDVAELGGE